MRTEKLQSAHSGRIKWGSGTQNEREFSIDATVTNYQEATSFMGRKEHMLDFIQASTRQWNQFCPLATKDCNIVPPRESDVTFGIYTARGV